MRAITWRRGTAPRVITVVSALVVSAMWAAGPASAADVTPPAPPAAPDLVASSDTGESSADNLTGDNTPTFDVASVESESTVTVYANGSAVASASVPVGYSLVSVTTPELADGVYVITATATDLAGNTSSPSAAMAPNLVIDTTDVTPPAPPAAPDLVASSDTGESSVDNLTGDNTPTFDVASVESESTVTLYANGSAVASASVPVGYSLVSVTTPELADGVYVITATATDLGGNTSSSSVAMAPNLVIDTQAPQLSQPEDVVAYTTSPDGTTVGYENPTATDAVDVDPIVVCEPASGSLFAPGETTVTCTATDGAGNRGSVTFTATVNSAATALAALRGDVVSLGLKAGPERQLLALLDTARTALAAGYDEAAVANLRTFISRTLRMPAKQLTPAQAQALNTEAGVVIDWIEAS